MNKRPTPPLVSKRLELEPLDPALAAEMVEVLADPSLYDFIGGAPPTLDDLERRYRAQVIGPPEPDVTWHNWIVRLTSSRTAVGFVQATVEGGTAELAWVIGARWQGRGYASEAADAMSSWLASDGLAPLTAHIHPAHSASGRVASNIGLHPTGEIDDEGEMIWSSVPTGT